MSACITVAFNDTCPLGFFCPHSNATNPPQVCMPSPECAIKRSHGNLCEPQGLLEPHVCKPGHYCPVGGKNQRLCPANHFCPIGSYEPLKCGYGTICRPGAAAEIYPVPACIALVLDILLLIRIGVVLYHEKAAAKRKHQVKRDEEIGLQNSTDGATELQVLYPRSVTIIDQEIPRRRRRRSIRPTVQVPPNQAEVAILNYIRRARVESGLDFEFVTGEGQQNRIPRGRIVGVIGPGKTNFIRVLAGQQDTLKKSEGKLEEKESKSSSSSSTSASSPPGIVSIHINGHHVHPRAFRHIISVVPRDGITIPHLTIRENILHAARMRLPSSFSRSDIHAFVDALITYFNLSDLQNSYVGSSKHPTISDVQRRLVDIAMALAAGPTALFLDEPTSHMNLTEAAALFRLLKFISQQGVTIAVTMNQPTRDVWNNIFLGPSSENDHTPCQYPYTPSRPSSPSSIMQLKVASGDRGFPWFQQL